MDSTLFMPFHDVRKGKMFAAAYSIRNRLTKIVARPGEKDERRSVVDADNARPHIATVTRAFCEDNFAQIASDARHPPDSLELALSDFSLFLGWAFQKPPPRTAIRVCR
jgi:hypothetical protein